MTSPTRPATLLTVLLLASMIAACGGAEEDPQTASDAPDVSATAAQNDEVTAVDEAPVDAAPDDSSASETEAVVDDEAADEKAMDALTFTLDPAASEAGYAVREEFFAGALDRLGIQPGEVETVGSTGDVSGELVLLPGDPPTLVSGRIEVGLDALASDQERRDERVRERSLETMSFPVAVFEATGMEGFPAGYVEGQRVSFQLLGDLTIRDVTRPATFDTEAVFDGNVIQATASTSVLMSDFGIQPPSIGNMFDVADEITLNVAVVAR